VYDLDSHYVERDGLRVPLRQFKGDPISFDVAAFVRDLQRIKQCQEEISLPVYDRRLHDPVPDALTIKPQHTFVIVEGMLLLHDQLGFEAIKDHLDVCLFLDVDEPECHRRVVARKIAGGRDADDAEQHYVRVDRPNVVRVNERRERADLLLRLGPDGVILDARPGRPS
jgi:pantothenate kinase